MPAECPDYRGLLAQFGLVLVATLGGLGIVAALLALGLRGWGVALALLFVCAGGFLAMILVGVRWYRQERLRQRHIRMGSQEDSGAGTRRLPTAGVLIRTFEALGLPLVVIGGAEGVRSLLVVGLVLLAVSLVDAGMTGPLRVVARRRPK